MIATNADPNNGIGNEQPPGDWERVDDTGTRAREAYEHAKTGQEVRIERQRIPTQMRDPMTSTTDTGFRTLVIGESASAPISAELSAETIARGRAWEFMDAYPAGDFEIPHPRDQPYGGSPVRWEK